MRAYGDCEAAGVRAKGQLVDDPLMPKKAPAPPAGPHVPDFYRIPPMLRRAGGRNQPAVGNEGHATIVAIGRVKGYFSIRHGKNEKMIRSKIVLRPTVQSLTIFDPGSTTYLD
jgi:hypothetical protein